MVHDCAKASRPMKAIAASGEWLPSLANHNGE